MASCEPLKQFTKLRCHMEFRPLDVDSVYQKKIMSWWVNSVFVFLNLGYKARGYKGLNMWPKYLDLIFLKICGYW